MSYTANFERATVDYDGGRGAEALRIFEQDQPGRTITCEPGDGYAGEIGYFTRCILEDRRPNRVTASDGVAAIRICEAEERSILTRNPVAV